MMNIQHASLFSIPLAWDAHDQAQLNRQRCVTGQAKQVYLRTLAMYAVKYYLECMGIQAQPSNIVNTPVWCNLTHATKIYLPNLGSIECVPVLPDITFVSIPPESWGNRLAFIAVQFDLSLQSATILGYVETATTEQIPISQFQRNTTEDLLIYLDRLQQPHIQLQQIQQLPIHLSYWFEDQFQSGWAKWSDILAAGTSRFAYRQRRKSVNGFKVFDLKQSDEQVELFVGLAPLDTSELDVWVEVFPTGDRNHLPTELRLLVLDDLDEVVMQAQANETKNIQFQFSGKPGDQFSVQLMLGNTVVTQPFVI